ncbi:hypothetical protein [Paraburkholderia oxyphila]|uniref:hypothetical protein n=1 Tax=Paraburkholderia oxyphila TaxID=614212 RepID=UPI000ACDAD0A|nr:hypothetical protein [Paraburkholderia oxyphila]
MADDFFHGFSCLFVKKDDWRLWRSRKPFVISSFAGVAVLGGNHLCGPFSWTKILIVIAGISARLDCCRQTPARRIATPVSTQRSMTGNWLAGRMNWTSARFLLLLGHAEKAPP